MLDDDSNTITIAPEEAGLRLDRILADRYAGEQSRTYFQYLIDEQLVLLNGAPAKKGNKPRPGDEIEIHFTASPETVLLPEPIPLDVLYEDEHLLVINKAVGMVVHPAPGNWSGTLVNALLHHCGWSHSQATEGLGNSLDYLRPGIVHRLDKETSGVLVAAKTSLAHQKLVQLFAARQVSKEYLAICLGNPSIATINAPIGRHPVHRKMMAVTAAGKQAVKHCRPLAFDGSLSLVEVKIETGRTHQIRVHMQHHGTPILGDSVYGNLRMNKQMGVLRQMLHAHRLSFQHPITQDYLTIEAPAPSDFLQQQPK